MSTKDRMAVVAELKEAGIANIEIGRILGLSPNGVQYYINKLGLPKRVYKSPNRTLLDGRRKCVECGELKTPGAFKNERASMCTVCNRGRSKGKSA